ncbi:hypothetical protein DACRYDRAFT_60818 [Dacryopinax primogenitus]|uniref:Small ribosomal subunit protein bS18m n=1 Tax=Dacryopinax primogenitus (strain DJM 731) TaxID=1858805 RepID=M5GB99_DACPD|nr:uncharacterized protein DACRYDRAFT_60818 [Dacryopinax primogenitus]EJU06199.1 hypothetical protein DACRYDRAFT_60818 [Dacryopinax primogenitus]
MFPFVIPRLPSLPRSVVAGPSFARRFGAFSPTCVRRYAPTTQPEQGAEQGDAYERLASSLDSQSADVEAVLTMERTRRFFPDKAYAPWSQSVDNREFSGRQRKSRRILGPSKKVAMQVDPFQLNQIDPLDEYRNIQLLNEYVTETGRIVRRAQSLLTWRSQRRMGKAIRRAKAMGLIPVWSKVKNERMMVGPSVTLNK